MEFGFFGGELVALGGQRGYRIGRITSTGGAGRGFWIYRLRLAGVFGNTFGTHFLFSVTHNFSVSLVDSAAGWLGIDERLAYVLHG